LYLLTLHVTAPSAKVLCNAGTTVPGVWIVQPHWSSSKTLDYRLRCLARLQLLPYIKHPSRSTTYVYPLHMEASLTDVML
jgi:hypothetical protein